MIDTEKLQNKRIQRLEEELIIMKLKFTELITQIATLNKVGKGVILLAGIVLGIDVLPQ